MKAWSTLVIKSRLAYGLPSAGGWTSKRELLTYSWLYIFDTPWSVPMRKRLKLLVTVCNDEINALSSVAEWPWGDALVALQKSATLPWHRFEPRIPTSRAVWNSPSIQNRSMLVVSCYATYVFPCCYTVNNTLCLSSVLRAEQTTAKQHIVHLELVSSLPSSQHNSLRKQILQPHHNTSRVT